MSTLLLLAACAAPVDTATSDTSTPPAAVVVGHVTGDCFHDGNPTANVGSPFAVVQIDVCNDPDAERCMVLDAWRVGGTASTTWAAECTSTEGDWTVSWVAPTDE